MRRRQHLTVGLPYKFPGLDYDGEKLTCGLCGKRYKALNVHIERTHFWSLDDYREEFGLNKTQPLWIPELSLCIGESLRRRGLVGKNKTDFSLFRGARHKMSAQAKLTCSVNSKGKVMTLTSRKMEAQKVNIAKSQVKTIELTCSMCGVPYLGRLCDRKINTYCPDCRPKARKMVIQRWRINHPEQCREALARYRKRKSEIYFQKYEKGLTNTK